MFIHLLLTCCYCALTLDGYGCGNMEDICQHGNCGETNPWWAVDLGSTQTFTHVMLLNRRNHNCKQKLHI